MTREEASFILANIDRRVCDDELSEALDMAIKALEQEPCEDAISRRAVLDLIEHYNSDGLGSVFYGYEEGLKFANAVNKLPSVNSQEQKWIPISERLPEEEGDYLLWGKVCEDEEEYQFIGSYDSGCEQFGVWEEQFDRSTLGCLGSEFFEYASVIAWMPLPKPYRAESEE